MTVKVKTANNEKEYELSESVVISELLSSCGVNLSKPCGGRGTCGKCKVIASGSLSDITPEEREKLSLDEIKSGVRLACRARVTGDAYIDASHIVEGVSGLAKGYAPSTPGEPLCANGFAAAVDIGTTTVSICFYKMPECKLVKSVCVQNAQSEFGADVVTRTDYAVKGGAEKLRDAINNQIEREIKRFGEAVDILVVTGNTIMLHLYKGLPVDELAVYPFRAKSLFGEWCGNTYIPMCISAYVGADITCAILASDMLKSDNSLLVDIGTNCEIAYNMGGKLVCCSTAAGPAFEGAGISAGMVAAPGAIDSVALTNGEMSFTVIGGGKPTGICGSGLVDAVACMLKAGIVDETGYLEKPCEIGNSGVFITPADIRAVQLAKAAIKAGLETVCQDFDAVSAFYIAGGFGSFVNINSCVDIGLIPASLAGKVKVIGNAAGSGASMILQNKSCLAKSVEIARAAETTELSLSPVFNEKYIQNMYFCFAKKAIRSLISRN